MADRGRKAYPVSSHLCDERWQRHCMDLHKQRLSDMTHRIDTTKPETFDLVLSKGKRQMLDKERQTEVDRENAILLQKMVRIKEQDTRAVFRPWTARSTFQWRAGHYYDPATNTKTLDHINLTSSVSPRSIHYFALTRPGTAPPDVTARLRDMEIQVDNTKLLRAITTMRTHYSNEVLGQRHAEESVLVQRISNFRGPETSRYQPPGRSSSAARNPYLASQGGRASSSAARLRPVAPCTPSGQQRYYEEAQNLNIPAPLPLSRGSSRPATAVAGPRGSTEGLGETSPKQTSSRQGSQSGADAARRASGSNAGSRPSSAAAAAAATGQSFTFGAQQEEEQQEQEQKAASEGRRASSTSQRSASGAGAAAADDYADEQYEEDEPAQDERASAKEEEKQEPSEQARASGAGDQDAGGNSYEDEGFEQEAEAEPQPETTSAAADEDERPRESHGGDDAQAEAAGGEASGEFKAAAGSEAGSASKEASKKDDRFEDSEAELHKEYVAAEEAEMNDQFAAEMAADAGDDEDAYLGGGDAAAPDAKSLGGLSSNTAASPHVGGFAADWD